MIRLIRASDHLEFLLNANAVRSYKAQHSGTMITLRDGELVEVKNSVTDIMEKIEAWQKGKKTDDLPPSPLDPQEV